MSDNINNYFIFCDYDGHYPHRAVYIKLGLDKDLDSKITQIINIGTKIFYENEKELFCVENQILDENSVKIVTYWESLLLAFDHDHESDTFSEIFYQNNHFQYMNKQKYRSLSPNELHNKLMSKTKINGKSINVSNCVIVSNIRFDYVPNTFMRYFILSKNGINIATNIETIINNMSKLPGILSVNPSKKSETELDIWGYVKVKPEYAKNLIEDGCILNNVFIKFDQN
ncbi:hypothetical protein QLL95_gp0210 [Cotonvirus japonicus]|uniref:Uncharacterized protein n=1 Tax=Cotonvirus japonicus TaxID=2811091 RepID=A0ABM7NRB4_9VIRU|nr:hypothetical protein QLL95_gp0210 [Cotonvirus japonicus]BCS82699.1 hypothetical protein [Cotonvirus japonicus]